MNIETYWDIANRIIAIINIIIEGWLVYKYVLPFMKEKTYYVGISYSLVMLVLYWIPFDVSFPHYQGVIVAWIVMCLLERKNIKQKVFLASSLYLFRWAVHGVSLVFRDIMFAVFINTPYMLKEPIKQLITYIIVELIYYGIAIIMMYFVIKLIHRVYVNKREDISGKELLLLCVTIVAVMIGDIAFDFFSNVYVLDTKKYIWNVHPEYKILKVLFQMASFGAIFIAIVIYQKLKEKQREEKENLILEEQIESTKRHINDVEKLYGNIRSLKHDMGNHISVLENLILKKENDEAEKYLSEIKNVWNDSMVEIRTGNPVTDVILTTRYKEAEEKGIELTCKFAYPSDTRINAFDISVILNNAIENAFEGVIECENPTILVASYRKKNAYMIEVANSISKYVEVDEESGIPMTSKKDKEGHGYGLINIRKVARSYYGDIDINQENDTFTLSVMLMIE